MTKKPQPQKLPDGTSEDDADLLKTAVERYEIAWEGEEENVEAAYDDLKFRAGEQWPDEIAQQRQRERRPMLTISKLDQYIHQVTGDMRMNKPSIKVRPAGQGATPEIASIFDGLIRNIEATSDATTVYTQAGESQTSCGAGAFIIETDYTDDDAFEQDIRLANVPDPLNIVWDPDSRMITREDAKWCFLVRRMTYERFEADWPDAKVSSWDLARNLGHSDTWFNPRELRVAWYWVKKPVTKTLGQLPDGAVVDMATYEGEQKPVKTRKVESHKVVRYTITAAEVLEVKEWAGKYIPVIPVIGEEINVGDRTVRRGLIRVIKDAQRVYNYQVTTAIETHALAPKAPFILTVDMIKGQEKLWRQANVRNLPYLTYNPDKNAPTLRPERSQASTDISTSLALAQQATEDMHQGTGIYPSGLGQKSNEQSGKAVIARQKESDVGTFLYIDNLSKAIAYAGRQLVDLIPKIYDTQRKIRVLGEDGAEELIDINTPQPGQDKLFNDLSIGKYDVVVETGPSFSTKRAESAQAMLEFATMAPQKAEAVMDLIVDALDWPNKDKFVERLRMTLPAGLDPQIDAIRAQMQGPPQPDPVALAFAEESKAKAVKAIADAGTAQAKQRGENAKTAATIRQMAAETTGQELENAQKALELSLASGQLGEIIRNMVANELRGLVQMQQPPMNTMT